MEDYRVNLEVFAGPLDLLLYLVRKEEVDIYNIPISRITEQYLAYIQMINAFDIELAGDFLVMAATLMEIKSAMLLPTGESQESDTDQPDDPRSELIRQLLEYKRIKDAANLLADAAETRLLRFTRPDNIIAAIKNDSEPELDLDQVSIWTLLEAFDSIMKSVGQLSSYSHITDETPIDLYQIEMLHRLQTEGPMIFEKVFQDRKNRLVLIGLFLAMLELIRNQLIRVEQPENKGPIYLKALTDKPAEQAVQDAILSRQTQAIQDESEEELRSRDEEPLHQGIDESLQEELEDEDDPIAQHINAIIQNPEITETPTPRIAIQDVSYPSDSAIKPAVSQGEKQHTEKAGT